MLLLLSDIGTACRYTVREIGFADFGKDSYQLILFKDSQLSDREVKLFKNISYAALLDANITAQVIDVQKEKSFPLLDYYKRSGDGKLPNILFVSPEGRAKSIRFRSKKDFTQTIWDLLEKIITSPARDKLRENIVKSFGVICFIEGTNPEENIKALKIVESAIEKIERMMMSLPKPVDTPPMIITIKANETDREEILLWSLGWEEVDKDTPAVALLYGRGRRMGPMLKGNDIKEDLIRNMLRFIGEDCECGLDRNWMLGTMIPLRWDSKLKATVLARYGFDADNPLVISEMSQILSVAPERVNNSIDTDLLYGYAENVLSVSDSAKQRNVDQSPIKAGESSFGIKESLSLSLIGVIGIIIVGGFMILRARKKNS